MPPILRTLAAVAALALCAACQTPAEPAPQPPPKQEGRMCGGIAGLRCGEGEYCHMQPGQCRTVADAAGVCRPRPEICTMEYAPVCGCDGRTHATACRAAAAGTSVASRGECKGG